MSDWLARAGRPLNIAHRGGVDAYGPELLAAVSRSVKAGADAIELDVQATSDRQLVVFHDRFVQTRAGPRRLGAMTLAEARASGSGGSGNLPLLLDVLNHTRSLAVPVLLDLKSDDAIDQLVQVVTNERVQDWVAVASFHYRPLLALSKLGTGIPTIATVGMARAMADPAGFVWTFYALSFPVRAARAVKARALLCRAKRISARLVREAHSRGLAVMAWDITSPADVPRFVTWGIDGIVATNPGTLKTALDARSEP